MTRPGPSERDGRHDFDFLFGSWQIANRRLENPLDEQSTHWREFDSTAESQPILVGLGNIDLCSAPNFPGLPGLPGACAEALRAGTPSLANLVGVDLGQGQLDTPVVGRFEDGAGRFECDDVVAGVPLRIRFDWSDVTPSSARWQQSFSFDGGASYRPNWVMEFSRSS
jgi:hypothetical protein